MVKIWIKQLNKISLHSDIDFDKIILDIFNLDFKQYDFKQLSWFRKLFRIRIWVYRIIFSNNNWNIKILFIWKRWDIYKWLKNY